MNDFQKTSAQYLVLISIAKLGEKKYQGKVLLLP